MTYTTDQIRAVAERVLTPKQLSVFRLYTNGIGTSRIAIMLDISEPVARRTRDRALQLIAIELRKDAA